MYRLGIYFRDSDLGDVFRVVGHLLLRALLDSEIQKDLTKKDICKRVKEILPSIYKIMYGGNIKPYIELAKAKMVESNIFIDEDLRIFNRTINGQIWENGELLMIRINPIDPQVNIF